jgi:selenophosphate synthetase-related protein
VLGAPANSLRSADDVQSIQQNRNQQQQQQQLIEQAPALAGAARDLSQAGMLGNQ